jgi:thymidine kinase
MKNPQLIVFTGPMFSSKTTRLLMTLEKAKRRGIEVFCFKPQLDGRYQSAKIVSHMGLEIPAKPVENGLQILEEISSLKLAKPAVVAIDEAFMIEDLKEAVLSLYREGHTVVISSIQLSSDGTAFKEIESILPFATSIEVCTATCEICGEDAYYSERLVDSKDIIFIGGSKTYEPRCWLHFSNLKFSGGL